MAGDNIILLDESSQLVSSWEPPAYKPFRPFVRGTTMVNNHLLSGMILQTGARFKVLLGECVQPEK